MNKTEARFWDSLRNAAPAGAAMLRIEDSLGRGVPDVNICLNGVESWVELKIARGSKVEFQKGQLAWMVERTRAGGRCFVVVHQVCPVNPKHTVKIIRVVSPLPLDFLYGSMEHVEAVWTTPRGFWEIINEK